MQLEGYRASWLEKEEAKAQWHKIAKQFSVAAVKHLIVCGRRRSLETYLGPDHERLLV